MNSFATSRVRRSTGTWRTVWLVVLSALCILAATYLVVNGQPRTALTLTVSLVLVTLTFIDIRLSVLATLAYLVLLGDLRRLLIPVAGWSGSDPLLLIGPVFTIILFGYVWASQSTSIDSPLAKLIIGLMLIMIVQMFNPQQGGLIVGVAGAAFYLVPIFWFWIGRSFATPEFLQTLFHRVLIPLAIAAGLFGLYQTFVGYLPYQLQWYEISGYSGLGPNIDRLKPIAFFSSSTENAKFLAVCALLIWVRALTRNDYARLFLFAFLFLSVFLVGSRGPVVKLILVSAGLWAIMGQSWKSWTVRLVIAAIVGFIGLAGVLTQLQGVEFSDPTVQHYSQRQAELLTPEETTGGLHLQMIVWGIQYGFVNPLGRGLGSTTLAASKFGSSRFNSEADFGNMFISLGVFGGIIYLIIIVLSIYKALRLWSETRSPIAMALVAILIFTIMSWLKPGHYFITPFLWLCVGAMDRLYTAHKKADQPSHSFEPDSA